MFWETLWALVLGFGLSGAVQAFVPRAEMERLLGGHGPRRARARDALRCRVLVVLLRRRGDGEDALCPGRRLRQLDGLHVRLDEPRGRARRRALGARRLAVRRRRDPRRPSDDRALRAARPARARPRASSSERERGSRRRLSERQRRRSAARPPGAQRAHVRRGLGRRRPLLARRPQDAPQGDRSGLPRSPASSPSSSRLGLARPVHLRPRLLDLARERRGRPAVAIASFVCSVGNVPLAAALWHGGISFGGVISFVFADLITLPLLLVYRRYYGARLTLKLLALFWAVMSAAGLAVEELFRAAGDRPLEAASAPGADHAPPRRDARPQRRLRSHRRRALVARPQPAAPRRRRGVCRSTRSAACRSRRANRRRAHEPPRRRVLLLLRPLPRALRARAGALPPRRRQRRRAPGHAHSR